jgi:hypothetical protein
MANMTVPHRGAAAQRLAMCLALIGSVALAACSSSAASTPPGTSTPPPASAARAASAGASAPAPVGSGSTSNQTDTDWGRIWDELPVAFPVYPGAVPANEAQTDAVSATFAIDGAEPRPVALWMQAELERTGFRTEALNGPFEDGSFVLESRGTADCRIEVAVAPLGSLTTVTVRYGAACPSP